VGEKQKEEALRNAVERRGSRAWGVDKREEEEEEEQEQEQETRLTEEEEGGGLQVGWRPTTRGTRGRSSTSARQGCMRR
jgi:hypothetical protein